MADRNTRCEVMDISLNGALIEVPEESEGQPGDPCTLVLQLDLGESVVRMEGRIVHRREGRIGMRCERLDLESIEHLRRLVELNLGDDALLDRELAALIAEHEHGQNH